MAKRPMPCYTAVMKHEAPIGKNWAKNILANGYESDNKDPFATYAKVWSRTAGIWESKKLELGKLPKRKIVFCKEIKDGR